MKFFILFYVVVFCCLALAGRNDDRAGQLRPMPPLWVIAAVNDWNEMHGQSPLHKASREGDLEAVKSLSRSGADLNSQVENGWTPLHYASLHGHWRVVDFLISARVNMNLRDQDGRSPLHLAALRGRWKTVKLLIQAGALSYGDQRGLTPWHYAIAKRQWSAADLLRSF